jgi:DNA ligase-1
MDLFAVTPPDWLKPNLAATADPTKPGSFPCFVSYKIDGIRVLGVKGALFTRSMKLLPNEYCQCLFSDCHGLDGELVVGDPFGDGVLNRTSSGVMARAGKPDAKLYVFDNWDMRGAPFYSRLAALKSDNPHVIILPQKVVHNQEEFDAFEQEALDNGYEGIMRRSTDGKYKCGRSTLKEGGLTKYKRFSTAEMRVTGFEELMHNENEAFIGELGQTKRSTHKANQVPGGTLGVLLGTDVITGQAVRLGTGKGLTKELRQKIWDNQALYLGRLTMYKHFVYGAQEARRIASFVDFRDELDMPVAGGDD